MYVIEKCFGRENRLDSFVLASDLQALFRSYRLGQKKATYVYRLVCKGSMEEKIYFRQVNKQAMAQR